MLFLHVVKTTLFVVTQVIIAGYAALHGYVSIIFLF